MAGGVANPPRLAARKRCAFGPSLSAPGRILPRPGAFFFLVVRAGHALRPTNAVPGSGNLRLNRSAGLGSGLSKSRSSASEPSQSPFRTSPSPSLGPIASPLMARTYATVLTARPGTFRLRLVSKRPCGQLRIGLSSRVDLRVDAVRSGAPGSRVGAPPSRPSSRTTSGDGLFHTGSVSSQEDSLACF